MALCLGASFGSCCVACGCACVSCDPSCCSCLAWLQVTQPFGGASEEGQYPSSRAGGGDCGNPIGASCARWGGSGCRLRQGWHVEWVDLDDGLLGSECWVGMVERGGGACATGLWGGWLGGEACLEGDRHQGTVRAQFGCTCGLCARWRVQGDGPLFSLRNFIFYKANNNVYIWVSSLN